jgi:hypothetical protein
MHLLSTTFSHSMRLTLNAFKWIMPPPELASVKSCRQHTHFLLGLPAAHQKLQFAILKPHFLGQIIFPLSSHNQ